MSNELGRIAQGNDAVFKSNDCVYFIHHLDFPNYRKVTYENFVCNYLSLKSYQYIIGLVVGRDKLDYALDTGSTTASMLETIFLVKSVISNTK